MKRKKAPTKKLAKSSDLIMGGAGASKASGPKGPAKKKLPVSKKAAEKHKKSEEVVPRKKPSSRAATKKPAKYELVRLKPMLLLLGN